MGKKRKFYIIDQTKDYIVVDKPAGLLSVPIRNSDANNLWQYVQDHLGRHGVKVTTVHRIDRYTSGLMVFAKSYLGHHHLIEQFKNHEPERVYLAVVRGNVQPEQGELVHYLKLIKDGFRNVVVNKNQKGATYARLTYTVEEQLNDASLVKIKLDTGLKNQIRVQFADMDHPLIGDQHYAPKEEKTPHINRQALHAYELTFLDPRNDKVRNYQARIPKDMKRLLKKFRKG